MLSKPSTTVVEHSDEGVPSPRPDSDSDTVVGFRLSELDTHYAAQLKPSRVSGKWLVWMITFVAGTGFTLFGYDQGVMSSLLTLPAFEAQFPETAGGFQGSHTATLQSLLVAIYEIGCMSGALSNLYVGDRLGRRHTIAFGGVIMIVGAILQTAAIDYAMMLVARVITGVGNGLLTSTVPMYQSECSKPHHRGQLVLLEGSLVTFGIMISYWVDLGFYFTEGSISWRFPLALQIVFIIIMLCCLYILRLPESPRWLAAKGQYPESLAVLAALSNTSVDDQAVIDTFHGICDTLAAEKGASFAFSELTTGGKTQNLRRTLLGMGAQCFQQICGINLITYYLTPVLASLGLDGTMSRVIAGVNGTCYFLTSLFAIAIIERVGRRPLMLWTALLQAFTFAILAGLYDKTQAANKAAQVISVLCLFLFNTWFSVGWLGVAWLYPAEVTPLRIRAPANALSTATNWIFNFAVVMAVGPMFANIGWGTYALFAALNGLIIFPFIYLYFPETKRYSLEALDIIFAKAHDEGVSPVGVSLKPEDIPKPGSKEAERILGREAGPVDMSEKKKPGTGMRRIIKDRQGEKAEVQHNELSGKLGTSSV
ncbi:hypothetical protein CI109_100770 [Kwoniella shandongensis]|uniref:Uncharacterized protein n=1 Tax=Kwoniella shandongensis TaxID=1734106 RepID=A0A5M6BWI9_9TREE|nr:uncharacterized protein CI109_005051 [Kwoniella shandongensis]KAA5526661.1 hypothetical protein CI109_005051 [Kwoniella shandongensis]